MHAKAKILIVDDDPLLREMLRVYFEDQNNYEVIEAEDVPSGLQAAIEHLPHLILCDVLMPRLTGMDFIAAVRANPDIRHIPILVCSAKQPPAERECLEIGANAYLVKPVEFAVLGQRAKQLLGHPA